LKWFKTISSTRRLCGNLRIFRIKEKNVFGLKHFCFRSAGDDFEEIVRSKSEPIVEQDQAEILFADLFQLRLQSRDTYPEYEYFVNNKLKFTQFDMVLVQIAFFGGVLLYPEWYGFNGSGQ